MRALIRKQIHLDLGDLVPLKEMDYRNKNIFK
jgi:hypothetical protein